ncbi:MAG: sensor histidine kinase [Myxococcota bacterium]
MGSEELAELLGLIVHDLRNPAATLGANISFFKEVALADGADEELREAVEDLEAALAELRRGLDQVGWIGRWLGHLDVLPVADGDAVTAIEKAAEQVPSLSVRVVADERPLRARGGGTLLRLVELLLMNSAAHGRGTEARLSARRDEAFIVVELRDGGPAVAPELREAAFDPGGQTRLKGQASGRYSRSAGLLAARVLAEAMGASIHAGGEDGDAWFRVHLQAL